MVNVILYSNNLCDIKKFLNSLYKKETILNNSCKYSLFFENPVEICDIISAFSENSDKFNINMWINLDSEVFIKITKYNSDKIIRYLFERYPY